MEIESVRDLIIIIYGSVGIVFLIILLALLIVLFKKINSILDSANEAVDKVKNTSSVLSDTVIQPFAKAQGVFAGIKKTAEVISSLSKKGGGEKDG